MADDPDAIDLGMLGRDGDGREHDRAVPWWRWWAWWYHRHRATTRRWGQVLLVLAVCLPLAAAAPPSAPALAPRWTDASLTLSGIGPTPPPVVAGAHLYTINVTGGGQVLTARRLHDGSTAWRTRTAVPGEVTELRMAAGAPVVVTGEPHTAAYDPGTGAPLWHRPGRPDRAALEDLLLLASEASADGDRTITALEVRTGEVAGAVTVPAVRAWTGWRAPGGAVHLLTLDRDGQLRRHPMDGGAPVAAAGTPHRLPAGASGSTSLSVRDALVLVTDRGGPEPGVAAYDVDTLRQRWTVPQGYTTAPCGPLVCVLADRPGEPYPSVHGVDPATGVARWSASCADAGIFVTPCRLLVYELAGGRLWMEAVTPDRYTGASRVRSWTADAATGTRLSDPDGWALWQRLDGQGLLLGRSDLDRAPARPGGPFRLWWARTGGDRDGMRVLGAVDATACRAHHPYLVCWTDREGLTVWRIGD